MNITNISNRASNSSEDNIITYIDAVKDNPPKQEISNKNNSSQTEIQSTYSSWQKNILLNALDNLENNIQLKDIHPLDKKNSAPIETYQEALIELSYVKTPKFKAEASLAQANISANNVINLFVE